MRRALREIAVAPMIASGSFIRWFLRSDKAFSIRSALTCFSSTTSTRSQNCLKHLQSSSERPSKARNSRYEITEIPTYFADSSFVASSWLPDSSETTALVSRIIRLLPLITEISLGRNCIPFPGEFAAEIKKTAGFSVC